MNWKENFKKINSIDFWLIHIAFSLIIGLQAYFYRESTCIMDNAYYLFDMINRETFTIPHNRYIAVFAEYLPWLAIQLHLPLEWVLIGFSINFLVTTYLIFLIVWKQTKDITNGYFLLLSAIFLCHHQLFFRSPEYIAIPICFWFYISLQQLNIHKNLFNYLQTFLLLFILVWGAHTLIYIVILYVLLLNLYQNKNERKHLFGFIVFFFIMIFLKKKLVSINGYEQSKIDIFYNSLAQWKDIQKSNFLYFFREVYRMNYFYNLTNYILLISVILAIYKRRFVEILWAILFVAGLFFINSIMFLEENNTYMHYELYFYMISSIVLLFYYQNISHSIVIKRFSAVYFMFLGVFFLIQTSVYFKSRYDYLEQILLSSDKSKMAIEAKQLNWFKLSNRWAIDVEIIFISSLNGKTKTLFPIENIKDLNREDSTLIFSTFKNHKSENLNKVYFNLPDEKYTVCNIK
jgi:hypothetical protein